MNTVPPVQENKPTFKLILTKWQKEIAEEILGREICEGEMLFGAEVIFAKLLPINDSEMEEEND